MNRASRRMYIVQYTQRVILLCTLWVDIGYLWTRKHPLRQKVLSRHVLPLLAVILSAHTNNQQLLSSKLPMKLDNRITYMYILELTWEGVHRIKLKTDAKMVELQRHHANLLEVRLKVSSNLRKRTSLLHKSINHQ